MKHLVLVFCFSAACIFSYAQETERRFIYFNYNDYQLTPAAIQELDAMLAVVNNCPIIKAELYGHTDSDGDPAANMMLAQNRINAVQTYLVSHNVPQSVIVQESFGETQPSFSNETEAGMRKNRRVEIAITYTCAQIVQEDPLHREIQTIDSVDFVNIQQNALVSQSLHAGAPCSADTQRFTFSGAQEIVIKGKQGTEIRFRKDNFVDVRGNVIKGEIQFELIEVYKKSDMVRLGLGTKADGKLLESGGMVYINARFEGQPAALNPNSWDYEISFPTTDKKSDMSIFYADSLNGPVNWNQAPRNFSGDGTYLRNKETLDQYVFNSSEMGWINCDRFIGKEKLTYVTVDLTDTTNVSFALVFKDINSAMPCGGGHGPIEFKNVPIGYEVTLIAFRKNDDSYEYFSKDFTVEKNHRETVVMEKLTEDEFQERLKELN